MIFGINTTIVTRNFTSRYVRRVKFETIMKYHQWYLCQISLQIMLLFVYTTTHTRFVIFTCRYFKLNRDTTALSQPNTKNFWWSSINTGIPTVTKSTVSRPSLLLLTSCCLSDKSKLHTRARKVQPWWRRESCMVEEKDKRGVISWRKYLFLRRFLEFNHFSSFLVL